jgi:transcription antitermination factor NusG
MTQSISQELWFVAHTRPRCEKKLARYCEREAVFYEFPRFKTIRKYRGKTVQFQKPLFPGYLFLKIQNSDRLRVWHSTYVANLLEVTDQTLFTQQLYDILAAVDSGLEIRLIPEIGPGCQVRIRSGPLRGMDGWVEDRYGPTLVLLRLDFIGQAAAVKLHASDLELI